MAYVWSVYKIYENPHEKIRRKKESINGKGSGGRGTAKEFLCCLYANTSTYVFL